MKWIALEFAEQLEDIKQNSANKPQLIFKHSTRCSVSSTALGRLERAGLTDSADWYLLDLIAHRNISAQIAETFLVHHESPQVLLIKNGKCLFDESHMGINMPDILKQISN